MSKNFDKCLQVAKSQEGVFARYQVDVRDQDLSYHTKAGNLERIRTGIYRIAQTPYSDAEEYIVAYLWSREEGTLSHETALMLHDLSDALPTNIHLTVPTSWKSKSRKMPDSYKLHFGDLKSDEKGWYSAARVTNAAPMNGTSSSIVSDKSFSSSASPPGCTTRVDLSVGDRLVSVPESVEGTDILEFVEVGRVNHRICPRETHVAEKLHAWLLPRDLVDIGLMATELDFEMDSLREAIEATFKFRDTHEVPVRLPQIPSSWATQYARIKNESRELPWPELSDLTDTVDSFLSPVLREEPVAKWQPRKEVWR
jgi:hypothetical protein